MSVRLANVLLLQRNMRTAVEFYSKGLGLTVASEGPKFAELKCNAGSVLALKEVEGESFLSTGYSPVLSFAVPDLQETVTRLISLGAHLDGPIRYPTFGQVAALRAPDGQMISLHESDE